MPCSLFLSINPCLYILTISENGRFTYVLRSGENDILILMSATTFYVLGQNFIRIKLKFHQQRIKYSKLCPKRTANFAKELSPKKMI